MYSGTSDSLHAAIPGSQLSADLSAELVHFSDAVQPHGALLVLSQPDLKILQVSANSQQHFGVQPDALLGRALPVLLQQPSFDLVQQNLPVEDRVSLPLTLQAGNPFHATLYSHEGGLLLELEPADAHPGSFSWFTLQGRVKRAIAHLRQTSNLREFFQRAADEVRQITGFDRVLIYQFDVQGAGEVIAESMGEALPSYLGLHYPATDIPEPVRDLYAGGLVRAIPNLTVSPVNLVPAQNPITQQPLNLNRLILRGVDPCCITFHQNMGVSALLVISLLKDKTLWGLISCHHRTPKPIPYEVREACELLGHFVASELANKVDHEELDYILKLRTLQSEFVESIAERENLREALVHPAPRLLALVNAQGAAVCLEQEITLVGETPSLEQVRGLIEWADPQVQDSLFQTNALPKVYPPAQEFQAIASGLLLLRIAKIQRYYILWFRPEVLQTLTWAGDPHHAVLVTETEGDRTLSPRQSFEHWQEIVRATALPWKACELENAMDLRNAIVGIVLKKADELARINQELERSNRELDSFAFAASHDLKEPLRGIHNFSHLLIKDYAAVLDETGNTRLYTLIRLSRRMEALIDSLLKFSRLGQTSLQLQPTDLNALVAGVLQDLATRSQGIPSEIRIPRSLPIVACDPVLVNELFTNLISNALKYTDKPHPWIEIGCVEDESENVPTLYVRDNGIGIRQRHYETVFRLFKRLHEQNLYGGGTGAGLAIAKKIVERHGGRIWVESTYGEGSSFYFRLGSSAV